MENQKSNSMQWLSIAIIVASILISGSILYTKSNSNKLADNNGGGGVQDEESQPTALVADISKVKTEGSPFVGNINAPVVIASWGDYKCSFCKKLEEDAITNIIKDYVNAGKVKIVFKSYQFLGPDSQTAGIASMAVWEVAPNKFYDWHKAMYAKQGSGWGSKADILALTQSLGIDSKRVDGLMTTKMDEYQKFIDAEKAEGTAFGIRGTPGTIIGKQVVSGAQPYSTFKTIIDELLSN